MIERPDLGSGSSAAPQPARRTPDRRDLLMGLLGTVIGAAGGTGVTIAVTDHDRTAIPVDPQTVRVLGGDDTSFGRARTQALETWPRCEQGDWRRAEARYESSGATSAAQFKNSQPKLVNGDCDVVVTDPQYLPALADHLSPLRRINGHDLDVWRIIPSLTRQCHHEGSLYAVPLNADVPLLVANMSVVKASDWKELEGLAHPTDLANHRERAQPFWKKALEIARPAGHGSPASLLLETGPGEGSTACLVELLTAFGYDVENPSHRDDPKRPDPLGETISALHEQFARDGGPLAVNSTASVQEGEVADRFTAPHARIAMARLWPASFLTLQAQGKGTEEGFAFLPIPGGTLGGQVCAVSKRTDHPDAAEEVIAYLTTQAAQLTLYDLGSYLPARGDLYALPQIGKQLPGIDAAVTNACRRPPVPDYDSWSQAFQQQMARAIATGNITGLSPMALRLASDLR